MHDTLFSFITDKLIQAQSFVVQYMPVNMSSDEIYEDLLGDPEMAQAFSNAAKYLTPASYNSRRQVYTEEWGLLPLALKLKPTDKYLLFFFPSSPRTLTRQSRLSRALQLPVRVQRDWRMLHRTLSYFNEAVGDPKIMAFLFPWIRELIAEWKANNATPAWMKRSKDLIKIDREVKAILDGKTPRNFPRLTEQLNEVCKSGKALFAQYRMLESSHSGREESPPVHLSADAMPDPPDWLGVHLSEVVEDWKEELASQRRTTTDDIIDQLMRMD